MPDYIKYEVATGKILEGLDSVSESDAAKAKTIEIELLMVPDVKAYDLKYSKVEHDSVIDMTPEERAKVNADDAAAIIAQGKVPTFEKLLTALITKGTIKIEEVENATPYKY